MQETTNYKLKKIELTDSPPDITVHSNNFDIIDKKLKENAENATSAHKAKNITMADGKNVEEKLKTFLPDVDNLKVFEMTVAKYGRFLVKPSLSLLEGAPQEGFFMLKIICDSFNVYKLCQWVNFPNGSKFLHFIDTVNGTRLAGVNDCSVLFFNKNGDGELIRGQDEHRTVATGSFTIDSSEERTVNVGREIVYLKLMARSTGDTNILEWVKGIDLNHFYLHSSDGTFHTYFSDALNISDNQEKFTLMGISGSICNYLAIVR